MKSLTKTVMLFGLLFTFAGARAQTTQAPHLFDAFSNTISCNTAELERIFTLAEGSTVQLALSNNFIFKGNILNSIQRYPNLKSVLLKSTNFASAVFSISRRINEDNSVTFVGRILNDQYADGYELVKQGNNYSLIKVKHDDLLQDK
jgi:hypothetical protein